MRLDLNRLNFNFQLVYIYVEIYLEIWTRLRRVEIARKSFIDKDRFVYVHLECSKIVVLKPNVCTGTFASNCLFVLFRRLTISSVVRDVLSLRFRRMSDVTSYAVELGCRVVWTIFVCYDQYKTPAYPCCALRSATRGEKKVGGRETTSFSAVRSGV